VETPAFNGTETRQVTAELRLTPADIQFGDIMCGMVVSGIATAEHRYKLGRRIQLDAGTPEDGTNIGRLVVWDDIPVTVQRTFSVDNFTHDDYLATAVQEQTPHEVLRIVEN
jgi:hypothetical protein